MSLGAFLLEVDQNHRIRLDYPKWLDHHHLGRMRMFKPLAGLLILLGVASAQADQPPLGYLNTGQLMDCDVQFIAVMDATSGDDFGEPDRPRHPERLATIYLSTMLFCHTANTIRRRLPRKCLA
jgi:hypothetical protein